MEKQYNEIVEKEITKEVVNEARMLRIDISKVRTTADKVRKTAKEEYLRADNAIQGAYNTLLYAVKSKEKTLENIEKHFENIEKERILKLQNYRLEELHKYEPEMNVPNLGEMQDDVWNNYINGVKLNYTQRIEAEKKAEEERLEQARLQKLLLDRENQLRNYWQFVPEKHPSFETLTDSEWNDFIKEMQNAKVSYDKEQEKIRIENERLKKEAEELEKELIAIKEEEERKAQEEKEKIELENKKGDSDKVNDLINDLTVIKTKYTFKSNQYKKMYSDVGNLIDKVINHIKQ